MEVKRATLNNHKRSGVAILIGKKSLKNVMRDKEEYFIIAKGSVYQEDIIIITHMY